MKTTSIEPTTELMYGFFCEFVRAEVSGQTTPVGIWGETCRLGAAPPAVLPSLAFHAYVQGLGKKAYRFKLKITFPGGGTPVEVEAPLGGNPGMTSQNLNFNMMGVQLPVAGEIIAKVHINTTPPIEREFRLKIEFKPEGAMPLPPIVN